MTDDLFAVAPAPSRPERPPRKHRHDWVRYIGAETSCARCGVIRDDARARRGKSSRRLGGDQERRAERVYGWEKVGERGTITDLVGPLVKVQQKATRAAAPVRWRGIFRELDAVADGRVALLLLSYVAVGRPTEDYIVIRGRDWLDLFGKGAPTE